MAVNLAEKYADKIDQAYSHASYTDAWVNKDYDFDGVETVNVFTLVTQTPVNYDRTDTGDRYGGNAEMQDTVATYTLANDKAFKIAIDRGNATQSMAARNAGRALNLQIREQITPMIDKDVLATVSAGATTATQTVTVTAGAEYEAFLSANEFLDEANAPVDGRVCFCTPAFYNAIKTEITTNVFAPTANDKMVKKGVVGELDGVAIVKVPTSYMPQGFKALIWHKGAVLGAKQITSARIKEDSEFVDGKLLLGRYIFGNFVLDAKANAVAGIVPPMAPSQ